jgi:formylglycine-generating enzyme required for sulfatase activity
MVRRLPAVFSTKAFYAVLCSTALLSAVFPSRGAAQQARAHNFQLPKGYPSDLVFIPKGMVHLGIDGRDLEPIAELHAKGRESELKRGRRIQARELGDERIFLPSFFIGKHEVTNAQFRAYVVANQSKVPVLRDGKKTTTIVNGVRFPFDWWPRSDQDKHRKLYYTKNKASKAPPFRPIEFWKTNYQDLVWELPEGRENYPARYISYREAMGYCKWAGLRLPTEPEWNRALRGNNRDRLLWGRDWRNAKIMERLGYNEKRNRKLRAVCCAPDSKSIFGVHDLLGGVWEWTQSPFKPFRGFDPAFHSYNLGLKRQRDPVLFPPTFDSTKRVCLGGSYVTALHQPILAFTTTARLAKDQGVLFEDLGFRVAKSPQPAFDASINWKSGLNSDHIGDRDIDLPKRSELSRLERGQNLSFEQRGIERWDLDPKKPEIIKSYHLVSVIPVRELPVTKEKEFLLKTSLIGDKKHIGMPIAVVFSSETIKVKQPTLPVGKPTMVSLGKGIFSIHFRGAGLPRELEIALGAGYKYLKVHKKRPSVEAKEAKEAKEAAEREKAAAEAKKKGKTVSKKAKKASKRKNKRKRKPKRKKSKRSKRKKSKKQSKKEISAALKAIAKNWEPVVERYGMTDEDIMNFGAKKFPKMMVMKPGNLRVPTDRPILLFRDNKGQYLAWMPYSKAIVRQATRRNPPTLKMDASQNKLIYRGGPRIKPSAFRFQFEIPLILEEGALDGDWISKNPIEGNSSAQKKIKTPSFSPKRRK